MNILKKLPDDLQEMIYYKYHNIHMSNIKNELKDKINEKWDNMSIDSQEYYIDALYHTENAYYSIYDDNDKFTNPNITAFEGYFKIVVRYEDQFYISKLLIDPSYGDILLEVDKVIETTGDYHHRFLEDIRVGDEIEPNIYTMSLLLGS